MNRIEELSYLSHLYKNELLNEKGKDAFINLLSTHTLVNTEYLTEIATEIDNAEQ